MRLLMIGTGYVGLVAGTCFAEMGHHVVCLDIDAEKIALLNRGETPLYEPGLLELLDKNRKAGRISFTLDAKKAIQESEVLFLAVDTPLSSTGEANRTALFSAVDTIGEHLENEALVVLKSTAPIGTVHLIKERINGHLSRRNKKISFDVVANPEFLKEGSAVEDFMKPDRIILGCASPETEARMRIIYAPFSFNHDKMIVMDILSAEMTKYAANSMLALRISFMNELSWLAEELGASIHQVRKGIGSDKRIGYAFLYAGLGYGGSCLPKDVKALIHQFESKGLPAPLLQGASEVNQIQRERWIQKVLKKLDPIRGKTVAIWGLSFKPDTDDLREAPSLYIIQALLEKGAILRLFDPASMEKAKKIIPPSKQVIYCNSELEAAQEASCILLHTEWKQFRALDLKEVRRNMKEPLFFDGRNQYTPSEMKKLGFEYHPIGMRA